MGVSNMKRMLTFIFISIIVSGAVFAKPFVKHSKLPQDLFLAVESGSRQAVKKLLQRRTPVNVLNVDGKTALDIVAERGDLKMSRDLIRYGARVTTDRNARTLKDYFAARAGRFFVFGWFFMPWLWFGSVASLNKASNIMVLIK